MRPLVGVFIKSANDKRFERVLSSFAQGIRSRNLNVFEEQSESYQICDVAVIFGSWKDRAKRLHHRVKKEVIKHHRTQSGLPMIVLETPIIGRTMQSNHGSFRVGINHFLRDKAYFAPDNCEPTRWNTLVNRHDITVKPWRNDGEHILITLQIPRDASLDCDISKWAVDSINEVRLYTDRPIKVRPHPHSLVEDDYSEELLDLVDKLPGVSMINYTNETLEESLLNCWCSITYTSGLAVDSVISGTPTITMHPGNMAWPISSHSISEINHPKIIDRSQWFSNIAYYQWNELEMAQGLPWDHLKRKIISMLKAKK